LSTLSRLFVVSLATSAATAALTDSHLSTRDYLDMPEIFQVSLITGSLAMLRHFSCEIDGCECFSRWTEPDDVVAIVSDHVRRRPDSLAEPFGGTLLAALSDRCDR
jgi:hypothetical protein